MISKRLISSAAVLALASCAPSPAPEKETSEKAVKAASVEAVNTDTASAEVAHSANLLAQALFDEIFEEQVARSPESLTYLGRKDRYGEWDDASEQAQLQEQSLIREQLKRLTMLDTEKLDDTTKLNYQLLKKSLEDELEYFQWRHHDYPVNQMFGVHSEIPSLLISAHRIDDEADAVAYISRLNGVPKKIDQLIDGLKKRAEQGVVAPAFVFPFVIDDSRNVISGAPFNKDGEDSPLWADFKRKTAELEGKQALEQAAEKALLESFGPAYEKLISYLGELEKQAEGNYGAWKLPQGDAYYRAMLAQMTTTSMSAADIHQLGVDNVLRIHEEIHAIMKQVDFKGNMQEFFTFMREDPRFYYSNDQQGRDAYLKQTQAYIDGMQAALPNLFITLPKAGLEVKPVEAFREKSAGKAFYQGPSEDGKRPGMYYVNLYEMKDMPSYQMEALAYHEALPGHHMQIAINQEIEGAPKFRRYGYSYTAYIEGWGLYSEKVPKAFGFYSDPYSDFGRLAMELWRAARLVVDTGLHYKKWSREQAVDYLVQNTPNTPRDCKRAIERYMVMPGQATSYYIGMTSILKLRAEAEQRLGDKYDIREFHEQILAHGSLPLDVLEQRIETWILSKNS
ncbi:DUF885 domain-containing protein [Agaribacterium haliotis]|uniref:DUF885 domain-containing protein n=1 Tax=Agaribacterium haliotis TaxID=2013869 RepID=UPI000BB58090|nr:DUF885 domain-containing protein [Agaribacterium haliotis]